jgi:hypothetical protein
MGQVAAREARKPAIVDATPPPSGAAIHAAQFCLDGLTQDRCKGRNSFGLGMDRTALVGNILRQLA